MLSSDEIVKILQDCSAELYWTSEIDSDWQVFCWPFQPRQSVTIDNHPPTALPIFENEQLTAQPPQGLELSSPIHGEMVLAQLQLPPETPWRKVALTEFWQPVNGDEQYEKLLQAIAQHLQSTTVILIGEIEIDVYIVGISPPADLIGLSTKVVET